MEEEWPGKLGKFSMEEAHHIPAAHKGSRAKTTLTPGQVTGLSARRDKSSVILRAAHKAALGRVNFSCLRRAPERLAGLPTMASEGLSSWKQVHATGVEWQLGCQTEHPCPASGVIIYQIYLIW